MKYKTNKSNLIDISEKALKYGFNDNVFITQDVDYIIQNSEANLRQILYGLNFRILNNSQKLKYVYFSDEFIVNKSPQQIRFFVILDSIHLNNTAIIINTLSAR